MKAVVYRPNQLHGSWRPRSLVDDRGPRFPEEYREFLVLEAADVESVFDQYASVLGDVIFLGDGENLVPYVAAPFGYELVKFGRERKSHP